MSDRIVLTGMRFFGYHGVFPEETRLGQSFIVDVEMHLDLQPAGNSDDLTQTVHYGEVYNAVKQVVEGRPCQLIEAVAEKVAATVLGEFSVNEVVVRVHKPNAPIPGSLDTVTVEVHRRRAL